MGKGQKKCPECGAINGARAFQCKVCEYAFPNKYGRKRYNRPVINWSELKRGDCFRIVGGSGSYYVSPDTGERTYMSSKGKYIVCLLYTSPSPRDRQKSRMPSSA